MPGFYLSPSPWPTCPTWSAASPDPIDPARRAVDDLPQNGAGGTGDLVVRLAEQRLLGEDGAGRGLDDQPVAQGPGVAGRKVDRRARTARRIARRAAQLDPVHPRQHPVR